MKKIIHINQHHIRYNSQCGVADRKPVITCKDYKSNSYSNGLVVYDKAGNELLRVVYSPDKPLSCGAKVWIECDSDNVNIEETL
jgi:hypothetical protein